VRDFLAVPHRRAYQPEAAPLTRHPRKCADADVSPQAGRGDWA